MTFENKKQIGAEIIRGQKISRMKETGQNMGLGKWQNNTIEVANAKNIACSPMSP